MSETPATESADSVHQSAEATPETPATPEAKPPTWDGEYDPERAAKLVSNLRGENDSLKSALAEARQKVTAIEDAEKSDLQKASERADRAEQELAALKREAMVSRVARDAGIPDDLLEFLSGDTEDEIKERAGRLAQYAATRTAESLPSRPKPKLVPGHANGDVDGVTQLTREALSGMTNEQIDEARQQGRLDELMGKA